MKLAAYACVIGTALSFGAVAQEYTCQLTPTTGYKGVTPTQMKIDFTSLPGQILITDDVGPKIGRPSVVARINRNVGEDVLFNWQITGVPISLKPPTETKFYGSTVNYSGRLNQSTGALRIIGNFDTRVSSANTGLNMRAKGFCDRS